MTKVFKQNFYLKRNRTKISPFYCWMERSPL